MFNVSDIVYYLQKYEENNHWWKQFDKHAQFNQINLSSASGRIHRS